MLIRTVWHQHLRICNFLIYKLFDDSLSPTFIVRRQWINLLMFSVCTSIHWWSSSSCVNNAVRSLPRGATVRTRINSPTSVWNHQPVARHESAPYLLPSVVHSKTDSLLFPPTGPLKSFAAFLCLFFPPVSPFCFHLSNLTLKSNNFTPFPCSLSPMWALSEELHNGTKESR